MQKCGFPKNQRIEISASHLEFKSKLARHPFELNEIKGFDKALQEPVGVFAYGDKNKSQNVIVNIEQKGKNFLAGIYFNQNKRGYDVSDIRTIYPKENVEWLNWINQGKMIYGNKEKLQALIAQQRMNVAEVNSQVAQSPLYEHCLESANNILEKFGDVNQIFTDGNDFYKGVKERADIEQKFYGYYTEKGNLDARALSEIEAKEFYEALKNNDKEKISEYTEHEELHEISHLAKEIYNAKINGKSYNQNNSIETDNHLLQEKLQAANNTIQKLQKENREQNQLLNGEFSVEVNGIVRTGKKGLKQAFPEAIIRLDKVIQQNKELTKENQELTEKFEKSKTNNIFPKSPSDDGWEN